TGRTRPRNLRKPSPHGVAESTRRRRALTQNRHGAAKSKGRWSDFQRPSSNLAPQVGLEPTTLRLTAGCSAIELLRNNTRAAMAPARADEGSRYITSSPSTVC